MSRVIEIRSPKYVSSWDPKVLWWHAYTGCHPVNTTRDSCSKLEKCQILVCWWRGTVPCNPINPYLGRKHEKMGHLFLLQSTFLPFWNLISGLNMILRGHLSPNISQGVKVSQRHLLYWKGYGQGRLGPLKKKKSSKLSWNDEFWPKTWSHQILSIFGHLALNPFNTEHRAKIAVQFGILRMVILWPSQS